MTDDELVAQARELCEKKVAFYVAPELGKHAKENQIAWTTHLAEMEEHKNAFIEGNYNLAESVEGWYCQGCFERNDSDTPCQKLLTKAKRLLGVE